MNEKTRKNIKNTKLGGARFSTRILEESLTSIKTVVDIKKEPFLILEKNLRVVGASDSFYKIFQVEAKDTEKKLFYELGNGQWNIPPLKKLLESILSHNTFFKGFEVICEFPHIGSKTLILNARQIYEKSTLSNSSPPFILLVMEDVTDIMTMAKRLTTHVNDFEAETVGRTVRLELKMGRLEREMSNLKDEL